MNRACEAVGGFLAVLAVAGLLAPTAAWADGEAKEGAKPAPAGDKAKEGARSVEGLIAEIASAADRPAAAKAYTKARSLSPRNPEVYGAYLARMLALKLPDAAVSAAKPLTRLDPKCGAAWGVLAYSYGKKNQLPDALDAAIRAGACVQDDAGILHTLGQLVAWYEAQKPQPRLKRDALRKLDDLQAEWETLADFSDAYSATNETYTEHANTKSEAETEYETAKDEFELARKEFDPLDRRYREIENEARRLDEMINRGRDEIDRLRARERGNPQTAYTNRRRREQIERDVKDDQARLKRVESDLKKAGDAIKKIEEDYIAKRDAFEAAEKKMEELKEMDSKPKFTWKAPSPDCVEVHEATGDVEIDPDPKDTPKGDKGDKATKRLKMARLYASNDQPDKAISLCKEILRLYPKTAAAADAAKMVKELGEK